MCFIGIIKNFNNSLDYIVEEGGILTLIYQNKSKYFFELTVWSVGWSNLGCWIIFDFLFKNFARKHHQGTNNALVI